MPTLARDIQQLNLSQNSVASLGEAEFYKKNFRNLQKLYLSSNSLSRIDSSAFFKLTGLVELDLSDNQVSDLCGFEAASSRAKQLATTTSELSPDANNNNNNNSDSRAFGPPESLDGWGSSSVQLMQEDAKARHQAGFLDELVQLRQLNLASNKLTRLGAFVLSKLVSLRQLVLSK